MSCEMNGKKALSRGKPREDLSKLSKDELFSKISYLQCRVDDLERKLYCGSNNDKEPIILNAVGAISLLMNGNAEEPDGKEACNSVDITNALSSQEEKFRQQQLEASRRENVLVMRLTTKEQEVQEYLAQLEELRAGITGGGNIKNTLLDPAVNVIFQRMKSELEQTKEKLDQTAQEFDAWKFTPDSATGKRLMAKCRMLIQENEELGKSTCTGRIAKLEGDLTVTRKVCDELKNSQTDIMAFIMEMEESMEGMQSTAMSLQRRVDSLSEENQRLRRCLGDKEGATTAVAAAESPPVEKTDNRPTSAATTKKRSHDDVTGDGDQGPSPRPPGGDGKKRYCRPDGKKATAAAVVSTSSNFEPPREEIAGDDIADRDDVIGGGDSAAVARTTAAPRRDRITNGSLRTTGLSSSQPPDGDPGADDDDDTAAADAESRGDSPTF